MTINKTRFTEVHKSGLITLERAKHAENYAQSDSVIAIDNELLVISFQLDCKFSLDTNLDKHHNVDVCRGN